MLPRGRARLVTRPVLKRIGRRRHDIRNLRRSLLCGCDGRCLICDDDVDLESNEFVSQRSQAILLPVRRAEFKVNVPSFDISVLAQPGAERALSTPV